MLSRYTTKFGELWDLSLRELASEAGLKAIMDAGIYAEDVDALYGEYAEMFFIGKDQLDYAGFSLFR